MSFRGAKRRGLVAGFGLLLALVARESRFYDLYEIAALSLAMTNYEWMLPYCFLVV